MAEDYHQRNYERSTIGSYGHAIKTLAEGLQIAVEMGWVSSDEAKDEFRGHVGSIQQVEMRKRQAKALREEADRLENEDN